MTAPAKRLPSLEKLRSDPRVMFVDDERSLGNSIIVTLHDGFHCGEYGCHVFGEDSPTAALRHLRDEVEPCDCDDCTKDQSNDQ